MPSILAISYFKGVEWHLNGNRPGNPADKAQACHCQPLSHSFLGEEAVTEMGKNRNDSKETCLSLTVTAMQVWGAKLKQVK